MVELYAPRLDALFKSRVGRLRRVRPSSNGTAWMTQWHSTTRKPGRTLRRSVTNQLGSYGGTSSKPKSSGHRVRRPKVAPTAHNEAVTLGGLVLMADSCVSEPGRFVA